MAAKRKQNTDSSKNVLLLAILIILTALMIIFFSQQAQNNQAQTFQSHAASPLVNTFMCQRSCSSDATCNFLGGDLSCINGYCVNPKCPATADCACNTPDNSSNPGSPGSSNNPGGGNSSIAPTGAGASALQCGVGSYQLSITCQTSKARQANFRCIGDSTNRVAYGCRSRGEWLTHLNSICQQYCHN